MREIVHTAESELSRPREFLASAWVDARAASKIGWQLFRTGLRASRRRTLLGHLWLILPAVATAIICVYLQSTRVLAVAGTELPYGLHVLTGIVLWQTLVDALNAPLQELESSRHMIARSQMPHEALFLSGFLGVGLNLVVRFMLVLAGILILYGLPSPVALLLFPAGMLTLALMGSALGLLLAPWGLLYGDVRKGLPIAITLGFFLSPVFYPAPESGLLSYNPVLPAMAAARNSVMGPDITGSFLASALGALLICLAAWLMYRLARPHVVETLG